MASYTVVKGDTLWSIAQKKLGSGNKWTALAELNGIDMGNPTIRPGQVLNLDIPSTSGSKKNTGSQPIVEYFGLLAGTTDTLFAAWSWNRENTENYRVMWYYYASGIWFVGNDSNTQDGSDDYKNSQYSVPATATRVKFKVRPISKKKKVKNSETDYWTAQWSTAKIYNMSDLPPTKPAVPTVELKDYKVTATLDNLNVNGTHIQFQIVRDNTKVYNTGKAAITTGHASYSCKVAAGSEYKVRCRSVRDDMYSDWSEYSENVSTAPAACSIKTIKATSETSVHLEWSSVSTATSYELEYATKKEYFDGSDQVTSASDIKTTQYEKTGLESGSRYYFRVRSVNDQGASAWSSIKSVTVGKKPSPPTTWSSTTTCITGDPLTLNWVHNTEDGSTQTFAQIEWYVNGVKQVSKVIDSTGEADDKKTTSVAIDTSGYTEGTQILWRVRTAGVTKQYGEFSVQRTVDIYAPPTISIEVTDVNGSALETLDSFPFYIACETGPTTQTPIGYHVSIIANEAYETVDNLGNPMMVNAGDSVYSKHFNTNEQLVLVMSADVVNLDNNVSYTLKIVVSMNSGLNAEASHEFTVAWTDESYVPNAEISADLETLSTSIRPYCEDEDGNLIEGVTLSVYRREFDGNFTELVSGLSNTSNTYITDPHPSLDMARYRIVAVTDATGAVSYVDLPGYPIGEKAIIIQWDEAWSAFDTYTEDDFEEPVWSGSMLKLPYNIDVSSEYQTDVSFVNYIGRSHPVSYYGTQVGESASWHVEIDKADSETIYGLRRLATWMGDAYVREPSGSGYWANVSVSFEQRHLEVTVPVTLKVTRVSGGA